MKIVSFETYADYRIFDIVCPGIVGDGFRECDFTDADDHQGFAWREGAITIFALETSVVNVEVMAAESIELRPDTLRAIQLPFRIEGDSGIIVGGMHDAVSVNVAAGDYVLVCEQGYQGNPTNQDEREAARLWMRISFVRQTNTEAKILIKDKGLSPPVPLFLKSPRDDVFTGLSRGDYPNRIRASQAYPIDFYPADTGDFYDYCTCHQGNIVIHYITARANPFFCMDCEKEIELENLRPVLNRALIHAISAWRDLVAALVALTQASDFDNNVDQTLQPYRQWAYQELENIHSAVHTKGLSIRKSLEDNGGVFYYRYAIYSPQPNGYRPLPQCVQCGQIFHRYTKGLVTQNVCEACKICTYAHDD